MFSKRKELVAELINLGKVHLWVNDDGGKVYSIVPTEIEIRTACMSMAANAKDCRITTLEIKSEMRKEHYWVFQSQVSEHCQALVRDGYFTAFVGPVYTVYALSEKGVATLGLDVNPTVPSFDDFLKILASAAVTPWD